MHYGGFVVHRGKAIFRDRSAADVEAGRFPCSSVTTYVAPDGQANAGAGALLQGQIFDYKQEEEWVRVPLSVTATAPVRRLCLAALRRACVRLLA